MLRLAKEAAGCQTTVPEGETKVPECDGKVYGIRPSSLLTTYTIVIGIASAALMPLMGSIVDYTTKRRLLGRIWATAYTVLFIPQCFISESTWFMVAILQVIISFLGWGHSLLVYAYLPELSDDEQTLNKFTANFTVVEFSSTVIFLGTIVGLASIFGIQDNDVATARLGHSIAFLISAACFAISWTLFKRKPASHSLSPNASLWTEGFKQVWRTSVRIHRRYPSLRWFYIAAALGNAAVNSLAIIALTYLTDTLLMTSFENGIAFIILLLGSIPGGLLSGWYISRSHNAVGSSILSTFILIVNTSLAPAILTGPGQQVRAFCIAALWGAGAGWKTTSDKLLASMLIPSGQDAELMGMFLFSGQSLVWIPPLIFTGMNEAGVSQRANVAFLNVYFVLSVIAYLCMGDYRAAVALAKAGYPREVDQRSNEDGRNGEQKIDISQQFASEGFLSTEAASNDETDILDR
jgi:MFS-type transporter involved in bile tolerance (Atg22 family)